MNFKLRIQDLILYYAFRTYWQFIRKKVLKNRNKQNKPRLLFGATPIINNKNWANAMAEIGYISKSITNAVPIINKKEDFDIFIDDLFPIKGKKKHYKKTLQQLKVFTYVIKNYDILFTNFRFHFLEETFFWKKEVYMTQFFSIKTVVAPYGSDYYRYSEINDHSVKHNLLINVYHEVFNEEKIREKVVYWKNSADFMYAAIVTDGTSRWDALPFNAIIIDTDQWVAKKNYSMHDGKNGTVKIAHTPNHRGFKGTEYIIRAIEELQREGYLVELILIEKRPNWEVKKILFEDTDILVEQIVIGYALSAMEGMATGLPVISNLERDDITRVFRRYSYLNECPILSASPENIKEILLLLITQPNLRIELGKANRAYAEKYHSFKFSQYFFERIIDKVWYKKNIDTLNLFHPLHSDSYNNQSGIIKHPLEENKIPKRYVDINPSN